MAFNLGDIMPLAGIATGKGMIGKLAGKGGLGLLPKLIANNAQEDEAEKVLKDAEEKKDPAREKAREEALKKMEEESRKPASERRLPEFGSEKDFQLNQALNQLKGLPVKASTTLAERKVEKKED